MRGRWTFDAAVAWPVYDWMGVSKAALESVSSLSGTRPRRPQGVRVNLVAAGTGLPRPPPGASRASTRLAALWGSQAPLGWDPEDPSPVADGVCFLLSDCARGIAEILHVDGGFHAMGAPLEA